MPMMTLDELDGALLRQVQISPCEPGAEQVEELLQLLRDDEGPIDRMINLIESARSQSPLAWAQLCDSALEHVTDLRKARVASGIRR